MTIDFTIVQYHVVVALLALSILIHHSQSKFIKDATTKHNMANTEDQELAIDWLNLRYDIGSKRPHHGKRRSLAADYISDYYEYDEYYDNIKIGADDYEEIYDLIYGNDYDDELLDDFVDDLSTDELLYYYHLLNNDDYRFEKHMDFERDFVDRMIDEESDYYNDDLLLGESNVGKTINNQQTATETTFSFSDANPWPKNIKTKTTIHVCHGDIGVMRGSQIFTNKKSKIKFKSQVTKTYARESYTFEKEKEYKFKGLAWKKSGAECKNPPSKITDYLLRFSKPRNKATSHYISPQDLEKSIETIGVDLKEKGQWAKMPVNSQLTSVPANVNKKCLSFGGGGIRAAMGVYFVMRKLENKLDKIKCVSVISGGAWGFILWLFELSPGQAAKEIEKYLGSSTDAKWGWELANFEKWREGIQKHILKMTSLNDTVSIGFQNTVRDKLQERIPGATIYFVVESVVRFRPGYPTFMDYCWFKSSNSIGDQFVCGKHINTPYDMNAAHIKPCGSVNRLNMCSAEDKKERAVQLVDVLTYCSAAFAAGGAHMKFGTTGRLEISGQKWRLVDAGNTFNDPLLPYMVDENYKNIQIWNFDFYKYEAPVEIKRALVDSMKKMGKDAKTLTLERGPTMLGGMSTWKYDERIIYYFPMYGKDSKNKFVTDKFPTETYFQKKKGILGQFGFTKLFEATQWDSTDFANFKKEWNGHLETLQWGRF